MTIGENMRNARKLAGMTQKELAKKMKVTPQMISLYENDLRVPKNATLLKFAAALGTSREKLQSTNQSEKVYQEVLADFNSESILLSKYDKLNSDGKQEAVKRVEELTYIPKYKKDPED